MRREGDQTCPDNNNDGHNGSSDAAPANEIVRSSRWRKGETMAAALAERRLLNYSADFF